MASDGSLRIQKTKQAPKKNHPLLLLTSSINEVTLNQDDDHFSGVLLYYLALIVKYINKTSGS